MTNLLQLKILNNQHCWSWNVSEDTLILKCTSECRNYNSINHKKKMRATAILEWSRAIIIKRKKDFSIYCKVKYERNKINQWWLNGFNYFLDLSAPLSDVLLCRSLWIYFCLETDPYSKQLANSKCQQKLSLIRTTQKLSLTHIRPALLFTGQIHRMPSVLFIGWWWWWLCAHHQRKHYPTNITQLTRNPK